MISYPRRAVYRGCWRWAHRSQEAPESSAEASEDSQVSQEPHASFGPVLARWDAQIRALRGDGIGLVLFTRHLDPKTLEPRMVRGIGWGIDPVHTLTLRPKIVRTSEGRKSVRWLGFVYLQKDLTTQ